MLIVGGNRPDLRLSVSGKVKRGQPRIGTPLNSSTPLVAVPVSATLSNSMRVARINQAGIQSAPGVRGQVE
jgi:hypothetical protein